MKFKLAVLFILSIVTVPTTAYGQQSNYEKFQTTVNKRMGEIGKFQKVLQSPDMQKQLAALEWMLKSNDTELVKIAKNHGLFSQNPSIRKTTLRYILDSGPVLRMQVKGKAKNNSAWRHVINRDGTFENGVGSFVFKVSTYNPEEKWWAIGAVKYARFDHLRLVGTTLKYDTGAQSTKSQATLTLGTDGVMRGVLLSYRSKLSVSIDLKD